MYYLDRKARLRAGVDYQFFNFNSSGVTQQVKASIPAGQADFNNPNDFDIISVSAAGQNHLVSAYADNRIEYKGFFVTPGMRSDYLSRSGEATIDGRGLAGYKFPTNTTLAVSGGLYSSFAQTNWYRFNQASRREARVTTADYLQSEKATHRSAAFEQGPQFVPVDRNAQRLDVALCAGLQDLLSHGDDKRRQGRRVGHRFGNRLDRLSRAHVLGHALS